MGPFISTTFASDRSNLEEVLQKCQDNEIKHIELGSNHSFSDDFWGITKKFDLEYLVHNYFPIPEKSFVLNIASEDEKIYKKSIDHVKTAIDFCNQIGAKLYTFHPGFLTDPDGSNLSSINYDFQWNNDKLKGNKYKSAYERMIRSLGIIIKYAKNQNVRIAIETEGSFQRKDHLIMQHPEEYHKFMKEFDPDDIGINLNIGHLFLASKAFDFIIGDFINTVQKYIVAMELSHNNGIVDQHLPLTRSGWYWPLIFDKRFRESLKILEYRNTPIHSIVENINLFKSIQNEY